MRVVRAASVADGHPPCPMPPPLGVPENSTRITKKGGSGFFRVFFSAGPHVDEREGASRSYDCFLFAVASVLAITDMLAVTKL